MSMTIEEKELKTKVIADTLLLAIGCALIPLFYTDVLMPFRRGFYCDDETIRYPDHESTVTDAMLYTIGVSVGLLAIFYSQFTVSNCLSPPTECGRESLPRVTFLGRAVPRPLLVTYIDTIVFLFGECITELTTDVLKYTVGRLRPNFLDVCRPDFDCSATDVQPHVYVVAYNCTGSKVDDFIDIRRSFPSGHSSISAFSMLFAALYLHRNTHCSSTSSFLLPAMQTILFLSGAYIAVSRLADNKHHWSDIVAGLILGTVICLTVLRLTVSFHDEKKYKKRREKDILERSRTV